MKVLKLPLKRGYTLTLTDKEAIDIGTNSVVKKLTKLFNISKGINGGVFLM